jgi:hypothetical protein
MMKKYVLLITDGIFWTAMSILIEENNKEWKKEKKQN